MGLSAPSSAKPRSLPPQDSLRSFCRWFSTPSTGEATTRFAGAPASPLTLASLDFAHVQHPLDRWS